MVIPQQTQYVESMLVWRWTSVYDAGPTLIYHWINVLCLLWQIKAVGYILTEYALSVGCVVKQFIIHTGVRVER